MRSGVYIKSPLGADGCGSFEQGNRDRFEHKTQSCEVERRENVLGDYEEECFPVLGEWRYFSLVSHGFKTDECGEQHCHSGDDPDLMFRAGSVNGRRVIMFLLAMLEQQ